MDYFKILNLKKEPFSNSPDPEFFFQSRQHLGCLQKIELSIRLRKGLAVVMGDVGTGKTTLCRQLIRKFAKDKQVETHLILDPDFSSPSEFLIDVAKMLWKQKPKKGVSDWQLKETIKRYLFRSGVDEGKTVVLIIDEGQKLPSFCLETLREFLNYETNEHKLLQIVIFAQKEFEQVLEKHRNFADRINLYHHLGPLNFKETRSMIQFRLDRASERNKRSSFFSFPALCVVYSATKGYPRRIINLCHRIILTLIIQNRSKVGWSTARWCAKRVFPAQAKRWQNVKLVALTCVLVLMILLGLTHGRFIIQKFLQGHEQREAIAEEKTSITQVISLPIQARPEKLENSLQVSSVTTSATRLQKTSEVPVENISDIDLEKKPASSPDMTEQEKKFPKFLGELKLSKKETLGEMIQKVYGIYTNQYLKSVTETNEPMINPDRLSPGQVIRFPAIPLDISPSSLNFYWIEITRKESLEDAYLFLRNNPGDLYSARIIPCWNGREGLTFLIVHKEYFKNKDSALRILKELPSGLASEAKILNRWDSDTIFFANPTI
jgi:general secretion pathway protein A